MRSGGGETGAGGGACGMAKVAVPLLPVSSVNVWSSAPQLAPFHPSPKLSDMTSVHTAPASAVREPEKGAPPEREVPPAQVTTQEISLG